MNNISLILDNPVRDLSYVSLIAMDLAEKGFEVNIIPSNMRHYELIFSEPEYVLYPHQREGSSAQEISFLSDKGIEVGVLETEQHVKENYFINYQIPKNLNLLKKPKHIFSWGFYFSSILKKNKLYSDKQIKIVGNPRYDEYIFNTEIIDKTIKLLIATSFELANPNFLSKRESMKAFQNDNMSKDDYLRFHNIHKESLEKLTMLIQENFFNIENGLKLRPHPYENDKLYIKKLSKSLVLDNRVPIINHLKSAESFLHYHSVSSVDSAVLQIPSINMSWFPMDSKVHDSTRFMKKTSYQPNTEDEMIELVELINNRQLTPKLDSNNNIFEEFLYKLDGISYKRITDHIARDFISNSNKNFTFDGPFNDLNKTEHYLKFIINKKKWTKSKKYFSANDIKEYINTQKAILNKNVNFEIVNNEFKNLKLTSVKVVLN